MHKNNQRGIGLLELTLAFTIIAALILSVMNYYKPTQIMRRIQTAVTATQAVYYAGSQYIEDGKTFPDGELIPVFQNSSLLPANFSTTENPWNGPINSSHASAKNTTLTMTFANVPTTDCSQFKSRIISPTFIDPGAQVSDCSINGSTNLTITFSDYAAAK